MIFYLSLILASAKSLEQECQKIEEFQIDPNCSSYTLLVKTFTDDGLAIRNHRKILVNFNIDESRQFDKTSLNCHKAGQFEQFIHGSVCTKEFSVSFLKKCSKTLLSLTTSENKSSESDNSSYWVFKQILDIHYESQQEQCQYNQVGIL